MNNPVKNIRGLLTDLANEVNDAADLAWDETSMDLMELFERRVEELTREFDCLFLERES